MTARKWKVPVCGVISIGSAEVGLRPVLIEGRGPAGGITISPNRFTARFGFLPGLTC